MIGKATVESRAGLSDKPRPCFPNLRYYCPPAHIRCSVPKINRLRAGDTIFEVSIYEKLPKTKNGNLPLAILVSVLTFFSTLVDQKHKLSDN